MLVQCQNNNSTNFGELYVKPRKIERQIGKRWANAITTNLTELRELAKDVDIFIKAIKDQDLEHVGLDIKVSEKPRLFHKLKYVDSDVRNHDLSAFDKDAGKALLWKVKRLKEKFDFYTEK